MRLRQLALACGLTSLILSAGVSALGLGEVRVKSALNQPLQAEIQLLDTRDLSADQIIVALASPADFERNGLDRPYFYTEFQFDVQMDAPGGPRVLITSYSPVREPYLNFLVEARWSAGRLLREYTLLMDLPKFDNERALPTISSTPIAPAAPRATSPAPVRTAAPRSAPVTQPVRNLPADQYQVRANDTLWEIAKTVSRASGVSLHQAMMSLYEANPEAFINGNINLLRKGQVLRVPASDDMTARSQREAVAQFAALTGKPRDTSMGAQLDGSTRGLSTQSAQSAERGQVTLSANAQGQGQGSGADAGRGAALESELTSTLEELDKSRADNAELNSRVKELEAQVDTMEQLIAVSNEKLKALQVGAQQAQEASADDDAMVTTADELVAPEDKAIAEAVAPAGQTNAVAQASSAASAASVVPVRAPVSQPSLMDKVTQYLPWVGVGAALLLLGGYALHRRRQQALEDEEAMRLAASDIPEDDFAGFGAAESLDSLDDLAGDEGSPIERADVYISFGQYDRAEAVLNDALARNPLDEAVSDKLAELSRLQNKEPVDVLLAGGAAVAGVAAVSQVAADDRAAVDDLADFDLDLPDDTTVIRNPTPPSDTLDAGFAQELDSLSFDTAFDVPDAPLATAAPATDDDFDLDLDVNEIDLASLDSEMDALDASTSDLVSPADDLFDADLANLEAAFDASDFAELDMPEATEATEAAAATETNAAANAPSVTPDASDADEFLAFDEADLANLDSTFDLSEFELDLPEAAVEAPVEATPAADTRFDAFSLDEELLELPAVDEPSAEGLALDDPFDLDALTFDLDEESLSDDEMDAELDFLANADEAATKLDLARAYMDMGDTEGARDILGEVLVEGGEAQQLEAQELLKQLGA